MILVRIGTGLVQLAQDWSNDTQLANWESIGMIGYWKNSSQGWLLGHFLL